MTSQYSMNNLVLELKLFNKVVIVLMLIYCYTKCLHNFSKVTFLLLFFVTYKIKKNILAIS